MTEKGVTPPNFLSNPKFVENMGRMKKPGVRASMEPAIQAGKERYKALNRLKKDLFEDIAKQNGFVDGIKMVVDNAKEGNTKQLVDLIKILAPKDIDITSNGATVQMGSVTVDGKDLLPTIGETVEKKEE